LYWELSHEAFILSPVGLHSLGDAIAVEVAYSWALCYVVLNVATSKDAGNNYFGLAIGSVVMAAAIAAGPVSGCSLNPAVSLGSLAAAYIAHGAKALHYWVPYVFAPFVGSCIAAVTFFFVRSDEYGQEDTKTKTKGVEDFIPVQEVKAKRVEAPRSPPKTVARPVLDRRGSRILRRHDSVALNQLDAECVNNQLFCGLRWMTNEEDSLDVDASCVKFNAAGECLGAVYFANKDDNKNNIHHSGDQVTGDVTESRSKRQSDHDNESIMFNLSEIQANVHFLFFVANIFSSGSNSFKDVRECSVRLVDQTNRSKEILRFEKKDIGTGNALVISMIFRMGGTWYFKAIDESYQIQEHGTYRSLEPQLKRFCLQTQETVSDQLLRAEGP